MQHVGPAHGEVVGTATLQKGMIDFHVAVRDLQSISRREVVGSPGLTTDASASDPAAEDVCVIGVAGAVTAIGVNETWTLGEDIGVRCLHPFDAQLQLWQLWNLREIEAGIERWAC